MALDIISVETFDGYVVKKVRGLHGEISTISIIGNPPSMLTAPSPSIPPAPVEKAFVYHGPDETPLVSQIGKESLVTLDPLAPTATNVTMLDLTSPTNKLSDIVKVPVTDPVSSLATAMNSGTVPGGADFKSLTVAANTATNVSTGGNVPTSPPSIADINPTKTYDLKDEVPKSLTPWRLRIVNTTQAFSEGITFKVMPTIQESNSAQWDPAPATTHQPADTMVFKSSSSRSFNISVKMVARDSYEADATLRYINILRAWTKPYFGRGTAAALINDKSGEASKFLGAPPPILALYAYGNMALDGITCVLQSVDFSWPDDCDYVPASPVYDHQPVPVIMQFSMSFKETYSPLQLSNFNLFDYKEGKNVNYVSRDVLRARGDLIKSSMANTIDKMTQYYPASPTDTNMNAMYLGITGDLYSKLNASEMRAFGGTMTGAKALAGGGNSVVTENGSVSPAAEKDMKKLMSAMSTIGSIQNGFNSITQGASAFSKSVTSVASNFTDSVKSKVKKGIDDIVGF